MKKIILLASMLAMVLATAAPAFAQTATDGSVAIDNSDSIEYSAGSQNVIGSIETGDATQNGDATATATSGSVAVATVDSDADTSVEVSNEYIGEGFEDDRDYDSFYFGGYEDDDGFSDEFDGCTTLDFDNDGLLESFEYCVGDDLDLDGILDEFDVVVLYGDWDNDGFADSEE